MHVQLWCSLSLLLCISTSFRVRTVKILFQTFCLLFESLLFFLDKNRKWRKTSVLVIWSLCRKWKSKTLKAHSFQLFLLVGLKRAKRCKNKKNVKTKVFRPAFRCACTWKLVGLHISLFLSKQDQFKTGFMMSLSILCFIKVTEDRARSCGKVLCDTSFEQ